MIDPIEERWQDPLTVWHFGSSSFGFADGHMEFRLWSRETIEYFNGFHPWGYYPNTEAGIEDIRWMHKGAGRVLNKFPQRYQLKDFRPDYGHVLDLDIF